MKFVIALDVSRSQLTLPNYIARERFFISIYYLKYKCIRYEFFVFVIVMDFLYSINHAKSQVGCKAY